MKKIKLGKNINLWKYIKGILYWYRFIFRKAHCQYGDFIYVYFDDLEDIEVQNAYKEMFRANIEKYRKLQCRKYDKSILRWIIKLSNNVGISAGSIGWTLTGEYNV